MSADIEKVREFFENERFAVTNGAYIDEIGDRNFKRGEGVALLQGSELHYIKIPMVRDMEKMQQICIDALTREESPVEGGGEAASPQTVG